MDEKSEIEARFQEILEKRGRPALEKAKRVMLEGVGSRHLGPPLQHLAENWNDLLRPALIALSCEAVGGKPETTTSAAAAMTLICSSMNIYDNIMDTTRSKAFVPTLPGKFGSGTALIVAGLIASKAFQVLYEDAEREIRTEQRADVAHAFQDFLLKMSEAEMANLKLKAERRIDSEEVFRVLQMQAADMEACAKIGALVGCGTKRDIEQSSTYGSYLGTIINLRDDLWISLNLSAELSDRIGAFSLPYVLTLCMNISEKARNFVLDLSQRDGITPREIKRVVNFLFETGALAQVLRLISELIEKSAILSPEKGARNTRDSLALILNAQMLPLGKYLRSFTAAK